MHIIVSLTCVAALGLPMQEVTSLRELVGQQANQIRVSVPDSGTMPWSRESGLSFGQFDKNRNGLIERTEMPRVRGPVRTMLESRDVNGDGMFDFAEFQGNQAIAYLDKASVSGPGLSMGVDWSDFSEGHRESPRVVGAMAISPGILVLNTVSMENDPLQRSFFEAYDANKDGKVVREEIPEAMRPRMERLFQSTGKDALTVEDFERRPMATPKPKEPTLFELIDNDKDGIVTRAEIDWAASDTASPVRSLASGPLFAALKGSDKDRFTNAEMMALLLPIVKQEERKRTFMTLDVNKDGKISVEEAPQQYRGSLERLMSNGKLPLSSKVTFQQFEELLATPVKPSESQALNRVPAAFQLLDANRDGLLSTEEFFAEDAVQRLSRLDSNLDGLLSVAEFMGSVPGAPSEPMRKPPVREPQPSPPKLGPEVQPLPKPPTPDTTFVEKFFARFDKDKNGKITTDEVPEQTAAQFGSLDIDGDGAVSRAEMTEAVIQKGK